MAELAVSRRLAAILAADIAGYSRLMGENEEATVRDLKGHQAVVLPLVARFGGRIIDTAGDGILAEFPSVIHAVQCAIEIQRTMAERNHGVPESRRMQFRIGINIGDVIHDEARIYGDGINIAARLENIAEPGGICVSSKVREELGRRLPLTFRDLGVQQLKNIAHDVHVFAIDIDAPPVAAAAIRKPRGIPRTAIIGGVLVVVVVLAVTFAGDVRQGLARLWGGPASEASARPFRSVVVLPVEAVEPDDQSLAARLTDELTNATAVALPDGVIISTGLAAKYRGARDPRIVARELNVRYVVEARLDPAVSGSALNVKLVDSLDGSQIWAGSQSIAAQGEGEAVARIQNGLRTAIGDAIQREIEFLPEKRKAAWKLVIRAWQLPPSLEANREGQRLSEEALRLDPESVDAMITLAELLSIRLQDEPEHREEFVKRLDEVTLRATQLAPRNPRVWLRRQMALRWQGNVEGGLAANDEALRLDPFKGFTLMRRAAYLATVGRPSESLPLIERALVLDPDLKVEANVWRCLAFLNLGRDNDAIVPCEAAAAMIPYWTLFGCAAASNAGAGNMERAGYWKKKLMEANPKFTIQRYRDVKYSPTPETIAQNARWLANLATIGVPEK